MQLLQKLLNKINGLHYKQEYLCLAKEIFRDTLYVYLIENGKIVKDITNEHLFTGYSPLVFTLYSKKNDPPLPDPIEIVFSPQSFQPNDVLTKKDAVAFLSLKMIRRQSAGDVHIVYYEGIKGKHRFLSPFHQYMIGLNNRLYNKKTGNVFLHDNLYKQVQIAYSIPRIISLITVSDGDLYNLFPTDLHGAIKDQYYVSSLRHEGKAGKQVEAAGKIVISQLHAEAYKLVYSLGKNHMQELKEKKLLPFSDKNSAVFKSPLPQHITYYRELEVVDSFIHGIHKFFLYRIIAEQSAGENSSTLAHIHNCYATWRYHHGYKDNLLLR